MGRPAGQGRNKGVAGAAAGQGRKEGVAVAGAGVGGAAAGAAAWEPPRPPRCPGTSPERGEKKEGGEKERERGESLTDKWVPQPCGVHVSETGHQNSPMVKK